MPCARIFITVMMLFAVQACAQDGNGFDTGGGLIKTWGAIPMLPVAQPISKVAIRYRATRERPIKPRVV